MWFADVILPLAMPQSFTYAIPDGLQVHAGMRVVAPVGQRKFYSGIVEKVHENIPESFVVKELVCTLDDRPVVNSCQLELWRWIASYYMCTLGEVMRAAIPSGLKLESATCVYFNTEWVQNEELTERQEKILSMVSEKKQLSVNEIAARYKHKDLMRVVQSLVDMEALRVEELIAERYKPRYETCVRLHSRIHSEEQLGEVFGQLSKAPQQSDLLARYVQLSNVFSIRELKAVSKKELLAGKSHAGAFAALAEKQILEPYPVTVPRLSRNGAHISHIPELTVCQQDAVNRIRAFFREKDVVLLHGVTASGKTEIYIHLIAEQLKLGKQVLYLLPEIALTTQIINRLKTSFGDQVGIYHSKYSDAERVEIWNHTAQTDGYNVILGVRSAVFLPFTRLGLIIVDEEHENTYKQFEPAPRYNGRDASIVLAAIHKAKVLAGTATPSLESYHNALEGKYGLVELTQHYAGLSMPEIILADTSTARKMKKMRSHFHPALLEAIEQTLNDRQQILLFRNRRGFAPYIQCSVCESVPRCLHCDVSLTYHKFSNRLICHYCGYSTGIPSCCPECGNTEMHTIGFGTEKIEDEIQIMFPQARIARLDMDTSRTRSRYEKIIADFESGKTDILVGTQMISKGLNFENVHLAGILNADDMLNFPDFRAFERSFQLMTQVSGRTGRAGRQGKVIIQTSTPKHPVLQQVATGNYREMYRLQIAERQTFAYPPFYRLIRLTLKHKRKDVVHQAAIEMAEQLTAIFGRRVLGPDEPVIARIQTYYLENILLKIEKKASIQQAKKLISTVIDRFRTSPSCRSLHIIPDVDPM
ncbi:MAG: primosomal protein N' [Bacteroidales bacterium]|jgi:primosomal protein N' (replication factor Y)|nr:primosomal protein N' [Bacteroidales bacterium]